MTGVYQYIRKKTISNLLFIVGVLLANIASAQKFTNKGKEFWVGYGHNQLFTLSNAQNAQSMVLYLSAEQPANVTVSINGTSWVRTYNIPANTVIPTDLIPKTGTNDARILAEGFSNKGIHIVSDTPIVAYAHTYGFNSSAATMLLPVETYSYSYFSINAEQNYSNDCYSWFYVVANENNTKVRITPVRPTIGNRPQGVTFEVTLNKGEMYNVMGRIQSGSVGFDMSGSKIQSIPGTDGACHPIGVFSGSSRTGICLNAINFGESGGDFMMHQVFPNNAWGTRYLVGLTSSTLSPSTLNNNRIRVYIKEPGTIVRKNGVILSGLVNNFFYEYLATSSDYITATKPIMVAQVIPSGTGCGTTGKGDPEMFYISPIEQAVNKVAFYNTNRENIEYNYLTLIIPQNGVASLRIDGSNTFDYTYPHPNLAGYTVVVKKMPLAPVQHTAESDSSFTAITYGLGSAESYGYNAGTYINNLEAVVQVKNNYADASTSTTCAGTAFKPVLKTIYQPSGIVWHLSQVAGITPNANVTLTNPTPTDSVTESGRKYYIYQLPNSYTFNATGTFNIPVTITDLQIENCSYSTTLTLPVNVTAGPDVSISGTTAACAKDSVIFHGNSTATVAANRWLWHFSNGSIDSVQQVKKYYPASTVDTASLLIVRATDACTADTMQIIKVNPLPATAFTLKDSIICMPGGVANFINQTTIAPAATINYQWNFGDNQTSTAIQPQHTYAIASAYTVKLLATVESSGCKDSVTKIIDGFGKKPIAQFSPTDTSWCGAATIRLNSVANTGDISNYKWYVNNTLFSTIKDPARNFTTSGNYKVQLIISDSSHCNDTIAHNYQVWALPLVDAGTEKLIAPGVPVQLNGSTNNTTAIIRWTPATALSTDTVLKPVVTTNIDRLYNLTVTDANGCNASDSVQVKVLLKLYAPSAFSPNGDGINDIWNVPGLEAYPNTSVQVFNRWGQPVFTSTGLFKPWTGIYNSIPLPTGAYYYIIDTHNTAAGVLKGSVMLIR